MGTIMANETTINGVHVHDVQYGRTTRKSFARIPEILQMPNLIEVQIAYFASPREFVSAARQLTRSNVDTGRQTKIKFKKEK